MRAVITRLPRITENTQHVENTEHTEDAMNPAGPEDAETPETYGPDGDAAPTAVERIMNILRLALLPLAAAALVAAMIIFIPTLGDSSEAAEETQAQPVAVEAPPATTPTTTDASPTPTTTPSPTPSSTPPAATTEPPAAPAPPSPAPPAPVVSPMPTPSGPGEAAGAPAPAPPASPDGVAPTRITVPNAGIDVAVLPLFPTEAELASQSIVPPISDDGFWLTGYGAPGAGSTDTTYIAGHSWEGRDAPFDLFSTNVQPGDAIVLDTMAGPMNYVVDAVTTYDKDSLKNSDIWNISPNRLVIISCFTEDPWGKNVVVTASPA